MKLQINLPLLLLLLVLSVGYTEDVVDEDEQDQMLIAPVPFFKPKTTTKTTTTTTTITTTTTTTSTTTPTPSTEKPLGIKASITSLGKKTSKGKKISSTTLATKAPKAKAKATTSPPKTRQSSKVNSKSLKTTKDEKPLIKLPFQAECLKESNKYRAKHHAPPLKVDQKIVKFAAARCKELIQPGYLDKGHEAVAPKDHGESIFKTTAKNYANCTKVMELWYNENKLYKYDKPAFSGGTGRFIQLVYKATLTVGCTSCDAKGVSIEGGKANAHTFVVCNYKSPLNKAVKDLKANVLKP